MDKFHFTTIVSKDHLFKLMAMYTSLSKHCNDYKLYILCANEEVYTILKAINFNNVILFDLKELEDEEMLKAKSDRVFHAYCWTLKPVFLHYVMENFNDALYFAHLDADLCFFENPAIIFEENNNASLYLTHHHNSEMFLEFYDVTGIYNTGFVGCKNDKVAKLAVKQWRDKCLKNCPIKEDVINKVFGDQRYVEDWVTDFENVHIVKTVGANTALWNIIDYSISEKGDTVFVNNEPLVFYHFSGLTIIENNEFNLCWYYHLENKNAIEYIYMPYLEMLSNAILVTKEYFPWFIGGFLKREYTPDTHYIKL